MAAGSSISSFTRTRKSTACWPSTRRWSYDSAMYIIGRIATAPFTATGRSWILCRQDADLRIVQDRRRDQRAEYAAVSNRESPAGEVIHGELAVARARGNGRQLAAELDHPHAI